MADINGVTLSAGSSPTVKYTITYTKSRPSNTQMTYNFSVSGVLGSSGSYIGSGYAIMLNITVNNVTSQVRFKSADNDTWSGTTPRVRTLSVTCGSTTGNAEQGVTFKTVSDGRITLSSGIITNSSYTVTSSALLYSACGAPTACSVSATDSEGDTTLSWSGATSGTNNTISSYEIQYSESSNNSSWGSWYALKTVSTTATSGSTTVSPPSTRGYYRRYQIRTRGSAGSSYYSGWKVSSNSLKKSTLPTAPTSCSVSPTIAMSSTTLSWSGAGAGSGGHRISHYKIQYATSSDLSSWGAWTDLMEVSSQTTEGTATVSTPTTAGTYRKFRIRTVSVLGDDYYSPWKESTNNIRRNVPPSNPSSIKVVPQTYSTESLTFSWSSPSAGTSALSYYRVTYQESTDGGTTWGTLTTLKDVTAPTTSTTVSPRQVSGLKTRFCVQAFDTLGDKSSILYSSASIATCSIDACTAPTSVTVAASVVEGTTTLSWSGAAGGSGNAIVGYDVQYSDGAPGETWGAWSTYTTVSSTSPNASITVSPPTTRGYFRRFQIRTKGAAGASYYSGWTVSPNIRKNTLPTPPTSFLVSPVVYQSGTISLSWTGAAAGTSYIKQYVIQQQTSTDNSNWGSWSATGTVVTALGNGSLTITPPASWVYIRFRISVTDVLDAVSDYTVSASVKKNNLPLTPTLAAPKSGATTFNRTPRVLIQTAAEPDGTPQTVWVHAADGNWYNSADNPAMFSVSGSTASGIKTIFTNPTAPLGAVSVSVECRDEYVSGTAATRSFTVAAPPFAAITANVTRCKASHIQTLRDAINAVRDYYGLAAYAWGYEVVGGKTNLLYWPYHVKELRAALQGVIDTINTFAGSEIIPDVAWIPLGYGRPRADVMNQLRDIVLGL